MKIISVLNAVLAIIAMTAFLVTKETNYGVWAIINLIIYYNTHD